jgi:hypothetical protein
VLDGALFRPVPPAGTDPEIIVVHEARSGKSGRQRVFGAARFSGRNLRLSHENHKVRNSIRSDENRFCRDAKRRFRSDQDRAIPEFQDGSTREVKS